MSDLNANETPKAASKKGYRTVVLLLLTVVYGFNFIDRQIVGILAPFIQADLGLTNTQLGLLIGLAFAAFYTIMGIPLAFLADRVNRVNLLAISLAVWSGFTALTGLSQNFLHIALARIGVGIGEAGGSPPSHSMISDFYGKEERSGALGVYSLGIPLGIMSAYFLTAALLGADATDVNWRRIFIILGITGLFLSLIVRLVIIEPQRGAVEITTHDTSPTVRFNDSFKSLAILLGFVVAFALLAQLLGASDTFLGTTLNWDVVTIFIILFGVCLAVMTRLSLRIPEVPKHIVKKEEALKVPFLIGVRTLLSIPSWWWMCLGIAFASFASYAISGFQTKYLLLLDPEFNFRTIVIWIGIINGTFYVAGTYFGARLVDWKAKTDIRAYGTIPAISILLCLPLAIATFAVPTVIAHLAIGAFLQLCLGVYLGPSFAIAQTLAPIRIRAMSTALFFFILNMIALGGGPTFAGAMIDVFGRAGNVELVATRYAMFTTFAAYGLSVMAYLIVRKTLPKDWAAAEARNSDAN
ncbi:hypothetical protein GCM10009069_13440 [Algimonas arctica]|uniref:Major facilitator superfamily (MFS) profile domain-containing protein n=1 Tax=Algimonas arctica TaxID=1479486 RepID=A0A8J3CSA8_9PROT|nr:MFS transporter [Algimonas arctica]GHA91570.1 hypothetical protein GCM10009069_13440 [Algimonas arctica]